MVDEARVLRLLRSVSDDVSVLQRESGANESRREDPIWLRGVKYTFVTAIEACLDIAQQTRHGERTRRKEMRRHSGATAGRTPAAY